VRTAFTTTAALAELRKENVTGHVYTFCGSEFVRGVNVTAPVAGPLAGEICSQLHAGVLGTEVWKLAVPPALVSVMACAAGSGPFCACEKLIGPLFDRVTTTLGLMVRVTGIVSGLEGKLVELIVIVPV
jgi:hypothetical protein